MAYQDDQLTAIANAIRAKKGTTSSIYASNFASEIRSISTASTVLQGKYGYSYSGSNARIEVTDIPFQAIFVAYHYSVDAGWACGFVSWDFNANKSICYQSIASGPVGTHTNSVLTCRDPGFIIQFINRNNIINPVNTTFYWYAYGY